VRRPAFGGAGRRPRGLRSHLLAGTVRHRRARDTDYDFTHHAWYLGVDLDELEAVDDASRVLVRNRRGLLELRDSDHMLGLPRRRAGLREAVRAHLERQGLEFDGLRVTLVTYPRALGYVFNPVSFYLCHDAVGRLVHVLAEVSNTHGERSVYDFPPEASGDGGTEGAGVYRSSAGKRMYVSPFIDGDARYELRVHERGEALTIAIHEFEGDDLVLYARVQLERRAFSDRALLALAARDPLVPMKTIVLIGWHAFRLWARGVRWRRFRPSV